MISEGQSSALSPKSKLLAHSEAGQALIEYMLILMVVVVLGLSAIWRLSTAYRNYSANLFGNYFACLLETGELPGVADSICATEYQSLNLQSGVEKAKFVGGQPRKVRADTSVRITPPERPEPVYARTDVVGGGGNNIGRAGEGSAGRGSNAGKPGESKIGTVSLATDNSSARTFLGTVDKPIETWSVTYGSSEDDESEKKKKRERPKSSTVGTVEDDGALGGLRKGKFSQPINNNNEKKKKAGDEGGDISIGALLRLFLIVAIVIALLLLIGGQLLQISKGMEKG